MPAVYTYGIGLEHDAPRFTAPGDFLVYVLFVATFILVSHRVVRPAVPLSTRDYHAKGSTSQDSVYRQSPRIICPPSLILAEAVPGNEEDHPCISSLPHSLQSFQSLDALQVRWEYLEIATRDNISSRVVVMVPYMLCNARLMYIPNEHALSTLSSLKLYQAQELCGLPMG